MNVSRSGYYKWIKRKGQDNIFISNRKFFLNEINKVYAKHRTWGYHRIAAKIRLDTGLFFSDLLIHKICKANGIYSKARKKPYKKPNKEHIIYSNVISNNWRTTAPFQKITTDTTIFWNKGKFYDLTMYIDVFNNEIVAYDLSVSKHGASTSNHKKAQNNLIKAKIKRGYIKTLRRLSTRIKELYIPQSHLIMHLKITIFLVQCLDVLHQLIIQLSSHLMV